MQARHEYKHEINTSDYLILRRRLQTVLQRDGNSGTRGEYLVRSLYFDTPGDRALREKIDGVNDREKFRIRYYNANPGFIRLEKKSKHNGLCYKTTACIDARAAQAIISGDLQWMKTEGDPLLIELYAKMTGQLLRPRVVVDYIREPFVYRSGNVRITLDRDIRTALRVTRFLDKGLVTVPVGDAKALLEVKYDAFLPRFIGDILQVENRRATAFSKYAMCRIYG